MFRDGEDVKGRVVIDIRRGKKIEHLGTCGKGLIGAGFESNGKNV